MKGMPRPDSQRLALARELRAANAALDPKKQNEGRERDR